jgi:periplasmic protein TonB
MTAYALHDSALFSRRALSFSVIIGVHVLLFWGFSSGLATHVINVIAPPLQTEIIDEVQKRDEPPPPPPPKMERPPLEIPPPDVVVDLPVETSSAAITEVTNKPVAPAPTPAPKPEAVTAPFGRAGYLNNPPPEYPAAASRQGWEGTVVLRVRVLSNGKADIVEVQKSSGHKVLDEEAITTVRSWSFVPAKRGELAIDGWASVPIEFKLDS